MVGANVLGELAWSIENMLNRVIDNAISPSDVMLNLMSAVVDRIPEGVEAFRAQHEGTFEVQEMIDVAEALANGEDVGTGLPAEEVAEEVIEEAVEEKKKSSLKNWSWRTSQRLLRQLKKRYLSRQPPLSLKIWNLKN